MRLPLVVLAAALAAFPPPALAQRTKVLSADCIGDRCVIRDRRGARVATVTRETSGRLAVRDSEGRLKAKVKSEGKRLRVEEWPRR